MRSRSLTACISVLIISLFLSANGIITEFYLKSCPLTCKYPQPRSMRVAELVKTSYEVHPYMTVIYRCDEGTGCCKTKGKMCQVKTFQDLDVRIPTYIKKNYVFVNYTIRNHTECSCQNIKNVIK